MRLRIALLAALAAAPALAGGEGNLLPNGDFEKGLEGWKTEVQTDLLQVDLDEKEAAQGKRCAHLLKRGCTAIALDGIAGTVAKGLPAGGEVRVSAQVKGKGLVNTWLKLHLFDRAGKELIDDGDVARLTGSFGWREVKRTFEVPKEAVRATVDFLHFMDGEGWIDDVRVVVTRPGKGAAPREGTPTGPSEKAEPREEDPVEGDSLVPTRDLRAGKDPDKRYLLHGPKKGAQEPKDGWRVAIVLPGGPGTAEFAPFVRGILRSALPDAYLAAQPVALKWTEGQGTVWPTRKGAVPGMRFSTEEFVEAVLADLKARHRIDPSRVFSLSWSSSGPAAYALALQDATPVTGSYIAMSVFLPGTLALPNAKGRAFFLDHSPQDATCRFFHAEKARDALRKEGAAVELSTYEGGHGWHGDALGRIRAGFEWLEEHRPRPPAKEDGAGEGKPR